MRINASLTTVDKQTTQLQALQDALELELSGVQTQLTDHLNAISPCDGDCAEIQTQVNNLDKEADFHAVSIGEG